MVVDGLVVYMMDAVSGAMLHHATLPNAAGPVHVAMRENKVWLDYWHTRAFRTEVIAMELYESDQANDRDTRPVHSAFDAATLPHISSQTFVLPARVHAVGVSRTRRGITATDVFCKST